MTPRGTDTPLGVFYAPLWTSYRCFFICAQKSSYRQRLDIHKIENICDLLYLKVNIMDVGYEDVNWK